MGYMAKRADDYQAMMQELQTLLLDMQTENLDVDAALQKYERGQALIVKLEEHLKTAENKVVAHKLHRNEKVG